MIYIILIPVLIMFVYNLLRIFFIKPYNDLKNIIERNKNAYDYEFLRDFMAFMAKSNTGKFFKAIKTMNENDIENAIDRSIEEMEMDIKNIYMNIQLKNQLKSEYERFKEGFNYLSIFIDYYSISLITVDLLGYIISYFNKILSYGFNIFSVALTITYVFTIVLLIIITLDARSEIKKKILFKIFI
ncbi:hypothetical protein [Picrophilus oshimae]|uniref:Uncharacterized protein n=1 Tax=Picrophilus torridus (strain ATCC 700027 / DSM 9790 / JCM 10055 / NBRC 100828 / KAW 2/3) TaxID=1122961 RepID=A0A8G2FVC9_PICTO|nr:hypothetical protein [Picrophilus oshimae]SMD30186.1 hypothetical protein SAMN02745355_0048 [Picrophilus oshimae DSM 9789]